MYVIGASVAPASRSVVHRNSPVRLSNAPSQVTKEGIDACAIYLSDRAGQFTTT